MRRFLVVANKTLGAPELVEAIRRRQAGGPCEFYLLVPATSSASLEETYGALTSGLPGPPAANEESIARARRRLDAEVDRLRQEGATVHGEVGDADPLRAVSDLLARRQFDEIIVATRSPGVSRWLHWDLPSRIERKFHLPVTHLVVAQPVH
jgi:hypothetical protein